MGREKTLQYGWNVFLLLVGGALVVTTFFFDGNFPTVGVWQVGALMVMAFVAEYVDSSLGMGYGTTLSPLLLILGFSAVQIVPAVLLSEFVSGISAGLLHHKLGNVDFGRGTGARRTACILALCSIVGVAAAVILAVNLPKEIVGLYIGLMVLGVGTFLLFGGGLSGGYSWPKVLSLGTVAAFNKGISGGGYGPLLTGGQVLMGVPEKNAIGITSLVEGFVCLVGLVLYLFLRGMPDWHLAIPLTLGALLSVPAATWTVRILPKNQMRRSIAHATVFLGILTLIKLL